jgi:hypothetical protein
VPTSFFKLSNFEQLIISLYVAEAFKLFECFVSDFNVARLVSTLSTSLQVQQNIKHLSKMKFFGIFLKNGPFSIGLVSSFKVLVLEHSTFN